MLRSKVRSPSITSQESYSAVMITDLIADVPIQSETEGATKTTKEATNLAFDGQLDGDIPIPTLDDTSQKTNGAGISKGVLLNAVHFAQNDSKTKSDEKSIQLTATLQVPTVTQQISESKGFKDMSLLRKVAFGFSFLPSVLFVLCFAIILPCNVPPPCIDGLWVKQFNDTEATSGLKIPENIAFTALKHGESVVFQLDKSNGHFNEVKLGANSAYLECGKIMNKDKVDCISIDENGEVYTFDNSHSRKIWNPLAEEDEYISNPVILSGCENSTEAISLAVSNTKIKVLFGGNKEHTFAISDCDSVPTRLMSWKINGSSHIVFICEKAGEGRLTRVPKNVWCTDSKSSKERLVTLYSGALTSVKNSVLHPLNDGIVLWAGAEAFMIRPDGTNLWKISNLSHPEANRFILYGNFRGENKEVAFISSNLMSGLKVTLLDPSDGRVLKSTSYSNSEATEMILVEGKKKDYVLMLLKKADKDIVTTALNQINDISTTIVNFVSNEEVNHTIKYQVSEELAIFDLDGSIDSIKDFKDNGTYRRSIAAVPDENVLSIYILSTSDNSQMKTTEVRNINVANWDKSTKSRCKI